MSKRPVLLLDEPTNHLDFESVEALAHALRDYAGTIFFVSHDRTFVNLVATSIVEVKDGSVTLYPASYESYVHRAEREVEAASGLGPAATEKTVERLTDHERRKQRRSRINRLRKEISEAERKTHGYVEERDAINRHYLENPLDYSREKQLRLEELRQLVEETENRWLACQEELDGLEAEGT